MSVDFYDFFEEFAPKINKICMYPNIGYTCKVIYTVVVTQLAQKQLKTVPVWIRRKLDLWVEAVENEGSIELVSLQEVSKHDY